MPLDLPFQQSLPDQLGGGLGMRDEEDAGKVFDASEAEAIWILSYGMGVESHAIFERWVKEPSSRPFKCWSQVIIITSQVGEEHKCDTVAHVERRALPLMRELGVRFVEVARRGHLEEEGIVVLQDTRSPERLHPDGVYKLSDELLSCGTVPQLAGEHLCAMKFKAFVIETWLAYEFRGVRKAPIVHHVFGYNAEEGRRIANSDTHIAAHNEERNVAVPVRASRAPIMVFGFNSEEVSRIERAKLYDGPHRKGAYPLQEWGWNRQKCHSYILEQSGIDWKKSACSFCPFCAEAAKGLSAAAERWRMAPEQTAFGMLVEYNSLCFNPRGHLFRGAALRDVVRRVNVTAVLESFEIQLTSRQWGFYRVRRIYTKKGKAMRAVQRLSEGSRSEMQALFDKTARATAGVDVQTARDISYAYFQRRAEGVYPAAEGFFVIAPLFVKTKVRGSMEKFDARWDAVLAGRSLRSMDQEIDLSQMEIAEDSAAA